MESTRSSEMLITVAHSHFGWNTLEVWDSRSGSGEISVRVPLPLHEPYVEQIMISWASELRIPDC